MHCIKSVRCCRKTPRSLGATSDSLADIAEESLSLDIAFSHSSSFLPHCHTGRP